MAQIKVASTSEIADGEMKKVEADGNELLIANVNGEFFAIADICTHAQCSLSDGFLDKEEVTCPCHAGVMNVTTGKAVRQPIVEDTVSYTVKVEGNDIFVEI